MWKIFVLYTVEFWVSWNLRESFLNWVGDINYVTCIGVKLCNGSGVVCTFTALICSLWNLKVYLNFSLVWKLLTWGNDTNKRPFWLWYAWLIFCQIDFCVFFLRWGSHGLKWEWGGLKFYEISFVYWFSCCCYLFTYGCQFYVVFFCSVIVRLWFLTCFHWLEWLTKNAIFVVQNPVVRVAQNRKIKGSNY